MTDKNSRIYLIYTVIIGGIMALVLPLLLIGLNRQPVLKVNDQTIQNGQLSIKKIRLPVDGWVVLSATKYNQPTEIVGKVRLEKGRHDNIGIYVNVLRTTSIIEAKVYDDKATPGVFDPSTDRPLIVEGKEFKTLFNKQ